jgi:hypothetical protein
MIRILRPLLLALGIALLAACASGGGRLVKAQEGVRVFDLQFDTSMDWARTRLQRVELWTIDGLPLNEFVVVSKVRPNEHVFLESRERKRRPDGPWYRPGMRPDELRDVLLDAMRQNGWTQVVASNLRPARFGSVDGLRFEVQLTHSNGLKYRGSFAAAEHGGKLTHWFWLAPAEHYYGRDAAAVDRMFASARFVD